MNKLLTKVAKLVLGLSLAAGVGVAVGNKSGIKEVRAVDPDEVLTVSTTDQISPKTNGTGVSSLEMGDTTVTFTNGSTATRYWNSEIRIYKNGGSMSFNAGSHSLSRIEFTGASTSAMTASVGTYSSPTWTGDSATVTFTATNTIQIASISLYYKTAGASVSIADPAVSKLPTGYVVSTELQASATNFASAVTYTWSAISNGSYVTLLQDENDGSKCTVSSKEANNTGVVQIQVSATDGSSTATATKNITIEAVKTCAQARTVASSTAAKAYVSGIIYNVASYNSSYNTITYWMSDDGTGTVSDKDGIQVYSGSGLNKATFSSINDLSVGDQVVVYGDLKIYQTTTYEIDKENYMISYVANQSGAHYDEPTMKETTLSGFINATSDTEKAELYHFSAKVKSVDNATYGNLTLTNDTNDLVVYGSTADTSALEWNTSEGIYVYSSRSTFSSNDLTKNIRAEDTVEVKFIRYHHNETLQASGLIVGVTPATRYSVTYSAEDKTSGDVPVDSNSPYLSGETVTVLGQGTIARTGYDFAGWSDGNTTYAEDETFVITSDTTLTAQWTQSQGQQASNPPYNADFTTVAAHSYTQNKEFTLSNKSWVSSVSQVASSVFYLGTNSNNAAYGILNNNSTFSAVSTALAASDEEYSDNISNCHAYALLFEHAYNGVKSITLNWAGGNNAFQVYLFGDSGSGFSMLAHEDYAESGASVSGSISWSNSNASNFTSIAIVARPGTASTHATNKTLRLSTFEISATAAAQTYTITYDANGGTGTMNPTSGAAPQVAACTFTYAGYTFERWNTEDDGQGIDYAVGTEVSQNLTLYAIWAQNSASYTDTWNLAGYHYIYENHSGTTYYMNIDSATSSVKPSAVTTKLEASVFLFTLVGDNTFTITNGNKTKALYYPGSGNTVAWSDSNLSYAWLVDRDAAGELTGTYNISGGNKARYLCVYNESDWRTYNSATGSNRTAKTEISAFDYANEFLTTYTAGCNVNGGYTAANMHWDEAGRFYSYLSTADQNAFKSAQYTKSGSGSNTVITPDTNVSQSAAEVAARYDYIVGMYGTSTFADFMTRNPSPISGAKVTLSNIIGENTNTVAIIVIISLVSVTAIGGYFFIRRRKEN